MIEKFKKLFDLDERILKIISVGLKISIAICALAIVTLLIYYKYYISHDLYDGSFILFRTGLLFAVQFVVCGIAINTIKKQIE